MSTITREWLKQTIAELEQERDATPGVVNEDADRALESMRIALASLNAEPIYQCEFCHHDGNGKLQWHWEDVNKDFYDQYDSESRGKRRIIYLKPPAMDELLAAMEEVLSISDREHNAWIRAKSAIADYRAAMLTATPTQ